MARFVHVKNVKIEFAFSPPPSFHCPLPIILSLSFASLLFPFSSSFPLYSPLASSFFYLFSLGFHYLIKFSVSDLTVLWNGSFRLTFSGREKQPFLLLLLLLVAFLFPGKWNPFFIIRLLVSKLFDSIRSKYSHARFRSQRGGEGGGGGGSM